MWDAFKDAFLANWPVYLSLTLLAVLFVLLVILLIVSCTRYARFGRDLEHAMNSSMVFVIDAPKETVRFFNVMSPSDAQGPLPLNAFYSRFPHDQQPAIMKWIHALTDKDLQGVPDYFEIEAVSEKRKKGKSDFSMLVLDRVDQEKGIIHLQSYRMSSLGSVLGGKKEKAGVATAKDFESALAASSKKKGVTILAILRYRSIQDQDEGIDRLVMNQVKNVLIPFSNSRRLLLSLDENTFALSDFHIVAKPDGFRLAKAMAGSISRYLSLNGYLTSIEFRLVVLEHKTFSHQGDAILGQRLKARQYAFAEDSKILLYEKGMEALLHGEDESSFHTEVDNIIAQNKIAVRFRPVFDVRRETVFGYLSAAIPTNTYFDSMRDLYDYAHKTGDDRRLFSAIVRRMVATFVSENARNPKAKLFVPTRFTDRAFLLPVFSRLQRAAAANPVFLFEEDDVVAQFDPSDPEAIRESMREIKAKGYEVGIFLKNAELSLPASVYNAYDYFVCGFSFAGNATAMDAKIRSKLHSLVERLLKYKKPIIASDMEDWYAIEIIVRSGLDYISSDAFAPYELMLNPPPAKSVKKIRDMKS